MCKWVLVGAEVDEVSQLSELLQFLEILAVGGAINLLITSQ